MPDLTQYTELTLGKKTYKLAYDFDAIAKAEEITGLQLLLGINWHKLTAAQLRGLLYASLLKGQPEMKLADLNPLMRPKHLSEIAEAVVSAWVASNKDEEENPQTPELAAAENA